MLGVGRTGLRFAGRLSTGTSKPKVPIRHFNSKVGGNRKDYALIAIGAGIGVGATIILSYADALRGPIKLDSKTSGRIDRRGDSNRKISLEELEEHRAGDSIWVAIDGTVWDITKWLPEHPGGSQVLLENAGTDATSAFKGLHAPGTIEKHLSKEDIVGIFDKPPSISSGPSVSKSRDSEEDDWVPSEVPIGSEEERIQKAREELIGVNSLTCIDDLEKYAKQLLPATVWEYYSTGSDSESAMRNNASAYDRVFFRPRVMREVAEVDTSTKILGVESSVPFYISATARNGAGNPLGEIAVTHGAAAQGALQVLSHVASKSLEEVMQAKKEDQKIGWQLYMKADRKKAEEDIKKAHALGVQSIWLTVDTTILGKRIRQTQGAVERNPAKPGSPLVRGPPSSLLPTHDAQMKWSDIEWIKSLAPGIPIIVKGVGAWEDVALAKKYGADGVVLSNHGGRQLDFADAPLKTLYDLNKNAPEMIGRPDFSIFVDGGIRRGTDILKALCLCANAVGLGRPFIYAGTGWGSDGVEKAILLLKGELEISMRLLGVTSVDQLGPEYLNCERL